MTIAERKSKLLDYSAIDVRQNKQLFNEFVEIYVAEGGKKQDCMSCNFSSVFLRWQRNTKIKPKKMAKAQNTFKLLNPRAYIYIPGPGKFAGEVITKDAPDEYVEVYLAQVKGEEKEERIKLNFAELPVSMRPKKKAGTSKTADKKAPVKDGEK